MTLVMGIVNVTPDSFSDGGRFLDADAAIAHGLALRQQGADILDIGGESTRPGSERVAADVEQERVLPVVRALAEAGADVSIDTMNAATAAFRVIPKRLMTSVAAGPAGFPPPISRTSVAAVGEPAGVSTSTRCFTSAWVGRSRTCTDCAWESEQANAMTRASGPRFTESAPWSLLWVAGA